ncbi:ParB/RepB/Spo0J family partition protein [Vandammella animalimorsus]|uniref:Chromosome partitioning protein ParB n=1 Tax=Vandammella animalimorsus TaxID=2029117 RepID=A0A2A2AFG3_9BURK|nr:ParB/RepB/Spo0J family partition protein [Vandammella animalimorsus]PAT36478.1 chromosome partitioning protein ParB [Vandammella animalimorsus]
MTSKKAAKGLGRGLGALLGPQVSDVGADESAFAQAHGAPRELDIDALVPGQYQPRTHMDEGALYELAESIKKQGVMQPLLVRKLQQGEHAGRYEIIAGERRYRASQLAGLTSVPVLVREVDDRSAAAMALIENMQREDLNPLEEARGLQRLVQEFGLTHEQAAQAVGRSRSAASNLLRLLNLAEPVQTLLMAGDIEMGHARALLALGKAEQITAGHEIVARKLSVRETEALVKRLAQGKGAEAARKASNRKSGDVRRVEEILSDLLMAQVDIQIKKRTKKKDGQVQESGEIRIPFASIEVLNGVLERIQGRQEEF